MTINFTAFYLPISNVQQTLVGCSKSNDILDDKYDVESGLINVNAVQNGKYDEVATPMTQLEISKFREWLATNKDRGEKKSRGGGYPLWCVLFNPEIKEKAVAYCVPKDVSGLWLQVTPYNRNWVYYPLTAEDKQYFKKNLRVLKDINF